MRNRFENQFVAGDSQGSFCEPDIILHSSVNSVKPGPIKVYLASSWKNQTIVLELADKLALEGFEVDAFCRSTDKRYSFHWSELVDNEDDLKYYDAIEMLADPRTQRAFLEDRKWLDWADCVVMIMPCGRSSHLEAGYAKGKGKLLFIYGEFSKGEFEVMYGFADGLFRTHQFIELVKAIGEGAMLLT